MYRIVLHNLLIAFVFQYVIYIYYLTPKNSSYDSCHKDI